MTPNSKTKFKDEAQTRALTVFSSGHEARRIDSEHYVEGYAARYEPYVLYHDANGEPVHERFERGCFDACDMSDIIMQYDHAGKVLARTSNGTLHISVDENGLFCAADLGRTEAAMSSLALVVCGLITVVLAPVFYNLL
jgi:phage head maturation protease